MTDSDWPTCENSAHREQTKFRPQCYKGNAQHEVDIDRQPDDRGGVDTLLLCEDCYKHVCEAAPDHWDIDAYWI